MTLHAAVRYNDVLAARDDINGIGAVVIRRSHAVILAMDARKGRIRLNRRGCGIDGKAPLRYTNARELQP